MTQPRIFVIATLIFVAGITSCGRNDYTTWACKDAAGQKQTMILRQAQMSFENVQFNYCGSLGPNSYFDLKCPPMPQDANKVFTPSNGELISNGQRYQCNAL